MCKMPLSVIIVGISLAASAASASPVCADLFSKEEFQLPTAPPGEMVPYLVFAKAARALLTDGLKMQRINQRRDVRWTGPSKPKYPYTGNISTWEERLSVADLKYASERDRDGLDEFINVAYAVGMEQGRREIRSNIIQPMLRVLTNTQADLETSSLQHALSNLDLAKDLLNPNLQKIFPKVSPEPLVSENGRSEWPTRQRPARLEDLQKHLSNVLAQMYSVTSTNETEADALLNARLLRILEAGVRTGRTEMLAEETSGLSYSGDVLSDLSYDIARLEEERSGSVELTNQLQRTARSLQRLIDRLMRDLQ